jgi:flagellar biosynthesis/type III secretory pathway protein FliH
MILSANQSPILRGRELFDLPTVIVGDELLPVTDPTTPEAMHERPYGADEPAQIKDQETVKEATAFQLGFKEGVASVETIAGPGLAALDAAVAQFERRIDQITESATAHAIELALELTATLLQRELVASQDPGREAIAGTVALLPHREDVTFRLSPDDLNGLGDLTELLGSRQYQLIADASLSSGDVLVAYDSGSIDGRLSSALARVAEEMRS